MARLSLSEGTTCSDQNRNQANEAKSTRHQRGMQIDIKAWLWERSMIANELIEVHNAASSQMRVISLELVIEAR